MRRYDILVAGEINPDLILTGDVVPVFGQVEKLLDRAELNIGSSSAIFACGAARLGLRVAFVGVCGADVFGQYMLDQLQARQVDVAHVLRSEEGNTGVSVILNRGSDRAILTYPGLMAALRAEDVKDELLQQTRHLHVASYFLQTSLRPGLPDLFRRARSLGATTSLDTNYDPSRLWAGVDDLFPYVNVFLPNETEAGCITGLEDVEAAVDRLTGKVDTLVVKLGARGAMAARGGEKARAESLPVAVVDTVGAGDSFDAGFIYAYLKGWKLDQSVRLACVCGALSTRQAGGTAAQPVLEEAEKYL